MKGIRFMDLEDMVLDNYIEDIMGIDEDDDDEVYEFHSPTIDLIKNIFFGVVARLKSDIKLLEEIRNEIAK